MQFDVNYQNNFSILEIPINFYGHPAKMGLMKNLNICKAIFNFCNF